MQWHDLIFFRISDIVSIDVSYLCLSHVCDATAYLAYLVELEIEMW
jgi:hypothetical protein